MADDRLGLRLLPSLQRRGRGRDRHLKSKVLDRRGPGDRPMDVSDPPAGPPSPPTRRTRKSAARKTAAVLAGKATGALSRATRRGGGTTLPGDVARPIDPKILTKLAADLTQGSIVITGTNGKTTTARLISYLLEGAGHRAVSNRAGATRIRGAPAPPPSEAAPTCAPLAEARTCPRCGDSLIFTAVYVGHDGVYQCPNHDFERPVPSITARNIKLDGFESFAATIENQRLEIPLGGLYNVYNVLAAFAVAKTLGLEPHYIADRLKNFSAAFGRQERMEFRGQIGRAHV